MDSCGMASFHCKSKWKREIEKFRAVYSRISIPQLNRSKSKKQKETEIWIDDGFKPDSRLDWKIVEAF